jgi:hypothetical protein
MVSTSNEMEETTERRRKRRQEAMSDNRPMTTGTNPSPAYLQQVAGIIIGSPEFQRR